MKKLNTISSKIKFIGALLITLILGVISTTIYLNQQNTKDALIINIVGKQRMLTQKISKNIFYIYYNQSKEFTELNSATNEFIEALAMLKKGDEKKGIAPAPTKEIALQLEEVQELWNHFYNDIANFKIYMHSDKEAEKLKILILNIYTSNTVLLDNVDKLVTLYTKHSENKTQYIKLFQYGAAFIFLLLSIYSLLKLRTIEAHVDDFMNYSKMLLSNVDLSDKLQPIELENQSEREIVEVSSTFNCFIEKINSAIDYSSGALLQSQQASQKLEELTDEFDNILDTLKDKSLVQEQLNNSEDIVIQSSEELLNSTIKLQNLKKELQKLTKSCQDIKK